MSILTDIVFVCIALVVVLSIAAVAWSAWRSAHFAKRPQGTKRFLQVFLPAIVAVMVLLFMGVTWMLTSIEGMFIITITLMLAVMIGTILWSVLYNSKLSSAK